MTHRAGCLYRFVPVLMDRNIAEEGSIVRVVPASGLGVSGRLPSRFAYIEHADGRILGMACSNSLTPLTSMERSFCKRALRRTNHSNRAFEIRSTRTETTNEIKVQETV